MKRHYEIMRVMRTKLLSEHELQEGAQCIVYIQEAITHRVENLTRVSVSSSTAACYVNLICRQFFAAEARSRETVPKLHFWDCGLFIISWTALPFDVLIIQFKYFHDPDALWSVGYVLGLTSQIIPYNDDNEDQNIQPGDILNHGHKDKLSLDYSVYDQQSTDYISKCRDVDPPMKDMYALRFICVPRTF